MPRLNVRGGPGLGIEKGRVSAVTISEILGYLSLAGYLAVFCQAVWLTWLKSRDDEPIYGHGFGKVPEVIAWALRHCFHQGFIVIEDRESNRFVQFRKYIPVLTKHGYGLEFAFPNAPWSKPYLPKLREALGEDGIPFREARETHGDVTSFIYVDCGQDTEMAVDLARRCFFDIFGLAPDTRFKTIASDYSVLGDEVVDHRVQNPSSLGQLWRALRAKFLAFGLPDPNLFMRFAGYTAALLFLCYPALWWAWFRVEASSPDWKWLIGPIHLTGSHATWVLLLIFWLLLFGFNRTRRDLARYKWGRPGTWIDKIGEPLIVRALPLAVITSWIGM